MVFDPDTQLPRGTGTVNEEFFDALIRHQIGLLRFSGSLRNRILKLLDASETDMARQIRRRLGKTRGLDTPASVRRMETLIKTLRATRLTSWNQVTELWLTELRELARQEPLIVNGMLKTVAPVVLDTVIPATSLLNAVVTTKPFEGKVMRDWARGIRRADLDRISGQIRIGMVQGESGAAIARRVVGSVRLRGSDGVTEVTRRQAEALTRTAVNAVANQARQTFYKANENIIKEEIYVATLDGRTTPICRSLDGQRFPVGEGSIPPLHFNCRSLRVAVLDGDAIGTRPSKPTTERGLLREFGKREGFAAPTTRAGLPRGTKGRFDEFSRGRIREMVGPVPAKVTYGQWLGRQSAVFQDDVLGKARGALFRRGDLPLDKFVNRAGDQIPLNQLARSQRQAFLDAGLDPEDFF